MKKFKNKLSNVLMSKSLDNKRDRAREEEFQDIDDKDARRDYKSEPKSAILTSGPKSKFIRITMAMLSSKGPFCEDRTILSHMRMDKGGVVDLAYKNKKEEKYKIKKVNPQRSPVNNERFRYTQRDRERAAKICQAWWREVLLRYKSLIGKIIRLQSAWRSKWLRLNMVDIIYAVTVLNTFSNKVLKVSNDHIKKEVFDSLAEKYGSKHQARVS